MDSKDLKYYKYILCESIEALNWIKKMGLSKDIKVLSSSPYLLFKDKEIVKLDKGWTVKKIRSLTKSINPLSRKIFNNLLLNKKISKEEALVVLCVLCDYFRVLYKAGSLNKAIAQDRILNIKLLGKTGRKKIDLNTPWEEIFKNNKFFSSVSYEFLTKNKKESFFSTLKMTLLRAKFIDINSIIFKLFLKFQIKKRAYKKNIFLLGENELLRETASELALTGFRLTKLKISRVNSSVNENYELIKRIIAKDLKKLTSKWVINEFINSCEEIFFKNLANELNNYVNIKKNTLNFLSKINIKNNKNILLSAFYLNSNTLGTLNAFKQNKVPTLSFQHGVTPEITDVSEYIAALFPANYCDSFVYFNHTGQHVAKRLAFLNSNSFIAGLPKKYFLTSKIKTRYLSKQKEVLFLSMNLYRGFFSNFNGYYNDFGKAKKELNLIQTVLSKIPYKVDYKPYVVENLRYVDKDPVLEYIDKHQNLNLLNTNFDARFLLSQYRIIINTMASSTLSWALLSEKPLVFINIKNLSPLKETLKKEIKEAIFYFDDSDPNYKKSLIKFMSQPLDVIESMYNKKKIRRNRFIKKYFSKRMGGAGKRTKDYIIEKYFC